MTYQEALVQLDALYAMLPEVPCQRKCQDSCGLIVMTHLEWLRITRQLGYTPKGKKHLTCPMLKQGSCVVHGIRPGVCRLFGIMDEPRMRCPFGCIPSFWMTEVEGYQWLALVDTLSHLVFPGKKTSAPAYGVSIEEIATFIEQVKRARR